MSGKPGKVEAVMSALDATWGDAQLALTLPEIRNRCGIAGVSHDYMSSLIAGGLVEPVDRTVASDRRQRRYRLSTTGRIWLQVHVKEPSS
jgi:hypothetical protein